MKKLNRKGFTLIELLAVIVILGILMLTAIPAVTRAIARSRRNTFWQNAKQYVKAATTPFLSGEYESAGSDGTASGNPCQLPGKGQYNVIKLAEVELEQGDKEKSSFGASWKTSVTGGAPMIVIANVELDQTKADNLQWYFAGVDNNKNGIIYLTNINNLSLSTVKTNTATKVTKDITVAATITSGTSDGKGTLYFNSDFSTLVTAKDTTHPEANILSLKEVCVNANK